MLFLDTPFISLLAEVAETFPLPHLKAVVLMTSLDHFNSAEVQQGVSKLQAALGSGGNVGTVLCYEEIVAAEAVRPHASREYPTCTPFEPLPQ